MAILDFNNKNDLIDLSKAFSFDSHNERQLDDYLYQRLGDVKRPNMHSLCRKVGITGVDEVYYTNRITKESLIEFGKVLVDDMLIKNKNVYRLNIPSKKSICTSHNVAFGMDFSDIKNKKVIYNNSYGDDMPQELKDFLKSAFDVKTFLYSEIKQQRSDVTDQSCALLARYNARDIWCDMLGIKNKKIESSIGVREDAWKNVFSQESSEVKEEEKPRVSGFKIISRSEGKPFKNIKEDLLNSDKGLEFERILANVEVVNSEKMPLSVEDFYKRCRDTLDYSMTNEPDYKDQINEASMDVKKYSMSKSLLARNKAKSR